MLISRQWLQIYFDAPLPDAAALSDELTFHVFEIDGIEKHGDDEVLDVKITANRGHDCNSYRGIAKEISAILRLPLKRDPFVHMELVPTTGALSVKIEDVGLCPRYVAGVVRGVKIGPSPEWLRERLAAMGQRSINNIVDATNYVMFETGQPLHAFDADKVVGGIEVRRMREGESLDLLKITKEVAGGETVNVNRKIVQAPGGGPGFLVIADQGGPLAVAGVKGGERAAVTESTTSLILESANFDGVAIRQTSRSLNIRTDASSRFEHGISPELAAHGMCTLADLIVQIAGGEVEGFIDVYPHRQEASEVSVTLSQINAVLGTTLTQSDVANVFERLGLPPLPQGEGWDEGPGTSPHVFTVASPLERLDLSIPEDLIEEVGRIIGYDAVPSQALPPLPPEHSPKLNERFCAAEQVREELIVRGYSEVFTSVFADQGERAVANKADGARPFLRATLLDGLNDALKKNIPNKALLGLSEIKLFEIGTVWKGGEEVLMVGTVTEKEKVTEGPLIVSVAESGSCGNLPVSTTTRYHSFSKYPFMVRDVAVWVPANIDANEVLEMVRAAAGELLVRISQFDRFQKNDRVSLAYRLVFQSFDRTLEDKDANDAMEHVYAALREREFEIR